MSRKARDASEILDKQPPNDKAAEMAVIGSLMLDPRKREAVSKIVKASDFYLGGCRLFFEEMMGLDSLDSILLLDAMRVSGQLEKAGGAAFLTECVSSVAVAHHAEHYAHIVAEKAKKRAMIHLNCEVLKALYSGKWSASELAERQIQRLNQINERPTD